MKIRVDGVPPTGQKLTFTLADPWAREAAKLALEVDPIALKGSVEIAQPSTTGKVEVALDVMASGPGVCARCGEDLVLRVTSGSILLFQPESLMATHQDNDDSIEEEIELVQADLDVGWYRGGYLSLVDILSEALALAMPTKIICEDKISCGARTAALLEGSHSGPSGHPAFAALKNLSN